MFEAILKKIVPFCFIFTIIPISFADEVDPNFELVSPQVKAICAQVEKISAPAIDIPSSDAAKNLKDCDAASYYYGFDANPDLVKARQCAYTTQNYGVLAMVYANGKGADRNLDLAIRYACKAGFAADEIEGRVMRLLDLKNKNWQGNNFDICDEATSGYTMGICEQYKQKIASHQRQQQMAAIIARWNGQDKKAFKQLSRIADEYFTIRGENEVDLSGTDRAAVQIEEEESLRSDFFASLTTLEKGQLPQFSPEQATELDHELNSIYQKIENNSDFTIGSIDRTGIKKTQLEWLKYREAWVQFGKIKYPKVPEQSWRAWVTEKRLKILEELADST